MDCFSIASKTYYMLMWTVSAFITPSRGSNCVVAFSGRDLEYLLFLCPVIPTLVFCFVEREWFAYWSLTVCVDVFYVGETSDDFFSLLTLILPLLQLWLIQSTKSILKVPFIISLKDSKRWPGPTLPFHQWEGWGQKDEVDFLRSHFKKVAASVTLQVTIDWRECLWPLLHS